MRSLYLALLKYKDHLVFLLAVFFSLGILLKNDSPNIYLIRGKFSDTFSFIFAPTAWIKNMTQLQEETQLLRQKNIQLSLQLESLLIDHDENKSLKKLLNFKNESSMELLPAKVLNMGISSITLNVGSNNGVKVNQPVLVPDGIIGKTLIVGKKSTIVQSIFDVNFRLSIRIYPSGATGILRYLNSNICEIREIQKNAEISIGDNVVTSGFSYIYPNDLPVGEVIELIEERGSFQKVAKIRISPNLSSILNAFIIIDSNIDEKN
tara:strand:- start:2113 stop:2904 length:792 start_codon:yes stop_codon:yes gene_type:complete